MSNAYAANLWIDSINEISRSLGGPEALVDLSSDSLIRASGIAAYNEFPFQTLMQALREEAELSGVGAILARTELVRALRARKVLLFTSDSPNRTNIFPEFIEKKGPIFIIGGARSGTSALLRNMSNWPEIRAPSTVEILYPEVLQKGRMASRLVDSVSLQDKLWDLIAPTFPVQHLNRGDLPSECLPILSCGFQSHHWTGCYRVPSYGEYLKSCDFSSAIKFHQQFALRLAASSPNKMLLFKSPAYALLLEPLVRSYPRGRFVFVHRDPVEVAGSHARLLATLRGMRSESIDGLRQDVTDAVAHVKSTYSALTRAMKEGRLNATNFLTLEYTSILSEFDETTARLRCWLEMSGNHRKVMLKEENNSLVCLEPPGRLPPLQIDEKIAAALQRDREDFEALYEETLAA